MPRKAMSKKTRFEVFKRDSFRCQYCGAEAPTVLLQVDHIDPVADGGTNDIANLVTSCAACNAGKSDRRLDDNSAIAKSKAQLDELQQRREQLELMMEWKRGLVDLSNETLDQVNDYFGERTGESAQTPAAKEYLRKIIKKFGASEVIDAIDSGIQSYLQFDKSDKPTHESVTRLWTMLSGICRVTRESKNDPDARELYYIRGIMRKRFGNINPWLAMKLMREARAAGISLATLRELAFENSYWREWEESINDLILAGGE